MPVAQTSFQERIGRVEAAHKPPEPKWHSPVVSQGRDRASWVLALWMAAAGLIATTLSRLAQYHLFGQVGSGSEPVLLLVDAACAVGLLVLLVMVSGRCRVIDLLAVAVAALFAAGLFHNLAHWGPIQMAALFSDRWVELHAAAHPANSFLILDYRFDF